MRCERCKGTGVAVTLLAHMDDQGNVQEDTAPVHTICPDCRGTGDSQASATLQHGEPLKRA